VVPRRPLPPPLPVLVLLRVSRLGVHTIRSLLMSFAEWYFIGPGGRNYHTIPTRPHDEGYGVQLDGMHGILKKLHLNLLVLQIFDDMRSQHQTYTKHG
jgi:hypothetical protein